MTANRLMPPDKPLTEKEEMFVAVYLQTFNASEAASQAFDCGSRTNAGTVGYKLLKQPYIKKRVDEYMKARHMEAAEAVARITEIARGDVSRFIVNRTYIVGGQPVTKAEVDIDLIKEAGLGFLIKSITPTRYGDKVEFHDSMQALQMIGKYLGVLTEKVITVDVSQLSDEQLNKILNNGKDTEEPED